MWLNGVRASTGRGRGKALFRQGRIGTDRYRGGAAGCGAPEPADAGGGKSSSASRRVLARMGEIGPYAACVTD